MNKGNQLNFNLNKLKQESDNRLEPIVKKDTLFPPKLWVGGRSQSFSSNPKSEHITISNLSKVN